jgi:hypothetical protein
MNTRQIIDFAADDDAKGMREALYADIYDRVTNAFEVKKQEMAHNLMGMPMSTEEVQIDEKEEEGHEDEAEDKEMCKDIAKKEVKGHEKRMHKEDEDLEEDILDSAGNVIKKVAQTAGKLVGGVAKTAGAIRQTPAAIGTAYNMGRAGAQKAIAK